jgi:DNA invertase Pin-like site-specific DNA recombinase
MKMIIGYARVSTSDQSLDAQLEALKAAGCERIYSEKMSGAKADGRKAFNRMLREVQPGDVIVVTRLDRLARSVRDLLNVLETLRKDSVGFKSLREATIDTTTAGGRLLLQVLAAIGEFEREIIQARCSEGRKRAMARGTKFGAKPKLSPFQRSEALARLDAGESQADVARSYGVDRSTLWRMARNVTA